MERNQMPYVHPKVKLSQQKFNGEKPKKKEGAKKGNKCMSIINNKRPRMNWTGELHERLIDIIDKFSTEKSVPRNVLELMNVPGLTRKQIADHLHKYRSTKRKLNQQKQPSEASPNMPLVVNHHGNQNPAAIENPSHGDQSNENQLQFSKNFLNDTMGSSSSNTLADVKSISSGLVSMEYGELFGSSSKLSLANNISNENGNVKVAVGSKGGSLQVPELMTSQISLTSLYDTMGSSSSNTLANVKGTSNGLASMEYKEPFGSSSQFSLAKNMSNENGNAKVALGSKGGSLHVPELMTSKISMNSLYDTKGSSSPNTLADVKSISSGLASMEYGGLFGNSSQLSLAKNMSNENGNVKVVFGSEGGYLQVLEVNSQISMNWLYDTMDSSSSNTLKSASSGLASMEYGELFVSSSHLSLANYMSNENGNARVAVGFEGDSLQALGLTSPNFSDATKESAYAYSVENTYEFGWEGIPDVFEGLDDHNVAGNYQYVEDSSGLTDLFRSFLLQVRSHPHLFDDIDFDELFRNEGWDDGSKGGF